MNVIAYSSDRLPPEKVISEGPVVNKIARLLVYLFLVIYNPNS